MQTFRFKPCPEERDSPHWARSSIGPAECWVRGENIADARDRLTRATIQSTRARLGNDGPIQPWMHADMAMCEPDDSQNCGPDEVRTADGRSISIED
jgi:hypothetical protein